MARLKGIRIPQCVEPELRECFTTIVENIKKLQPLIQILGGPQGDNVQVDVSNITNEGGDVFSSQVIGAFFVEGTLDGALQHDLTATLSLINPEDDSATDDDIEVHGFYVDAGKYVPAGARIVAIWNGFRWRAIVTEKCVKTGTPP